MRLIVLALLFSSGLFAVVSTNPSEAQIETIVNKFAAKEAEFAKARENYTYRQSVKIEELDASGNVGGEYKMVSDIIFSPDGKRTERVVDAPVPTLQHILLTPEDEQDLRNVQPFVLTTTQIPEYYVRFLGHQQVDEIGAYVFAVKPKKMEAGKRYFEGEIWVDDQDFQIVKTYGRGIGVLKRHSDNQFPKFETYRQQIDGKYWFPTFTIAEDTLNFQAGPQPIKMIVRYEDYKQFKSDVQIKFGDEVSQPKNGQKPGTQPPPSEPLAKP